MEIKHGYKQTEVGVIPEDWEVKSLGEIASFKNGINKGKSDFGYGYPFVNLMDVFGIPKISKATSEFGLINTNAAERELYNLKGGDVLFVRSSVKPGGVGLTTLISSDLPDTVFSGFLIRFRDSGHIEVGFKEHCFFDTKFRSRLISSSTVSANTNINQDSLKQLRIALPPTKTEQTAIATALSDADALIQSLERLIAKKCDIKQGAMQELLTGKKRLPGFGGEWEKKLFGEVFYRLNAREYQIQTQQYQQTGTYPVVDQGEDVVVGFSDREDKIFRCPVGGVIVFGDHTCIVKYVDFDFVVGADGTQILATKHGLSVRFFAYQLEHRSVQPTGYNRHFKFLKEREYVAPSLAEQSAIATILSDIDAEIAALESKLAKARQIKQGMMQELLTGRIRLT